MQYRKKINSTLMDMEEATVNTIVYVIGLIASVGSSMVVVGLVGGTAKDWLALVLTLYFIIIRRMEKSFSWFQKYAKYAYFTLPLGTVIFLCVVNDGRFAAATQGFFMLLLLSVAYHDVKLVLWDAGMTVFGVIMGFMVCPEAMLALDKFGVWIYIGLIYLMTVVLAVIIADRMRHMLEETRKARVYEEELVYLNQLQKKDDLQREFIHNINHYFIAIGELARIEKNEQILELVEELNGKLRKSERIIYSEHRVLNAIVAEKVSEAKEKDIIFKVDVEPILNLKAISDADLVAMLGNLFDNALEAAEQCQEEKRTIHLWIYMENEGKVCVVKLVNYFADSRIYGKNGFITTKKNREKHGIGVKSVAYTAKKYQGNLQCVAEEDKFTALLVLPSKS